MPKIKKETITRQTKHGQTNYKICFMFCEIEGLATSQTDKVVISSNKEFLGSN